MCYCAHCRLIDIHLHPFISFFVNWPSFIHIKATASHGECLVTSTGKTQANLRCTFVLTNAWLTTLLTSWQCMCLSSTYQLSLWQFYTFASLVSLENMQKPSVLLLTAFPDQEKKKITMESKATWRHFRYNPPFQLRYELPFQPHSQVSVITVLVERVDHNQ